MDIDLTKVDDIQKSTWKYIKKRWFSLIIVPILFVGITLWIDILKSDGAGFTMFAGIIIFFGYIFIYKKMQKEFFKEFASQIGFVYSESAPIESVCGNLFSLGHSKSIYNVMTGAYKNLPLRIFLYQFTIGYGKGSIPYYYTIFETTLKNNVPEMSLISSDSFMDTDFKEDALKLESNEFNKNFKLHVLKGSEQEAYQIFTPDVMTDLIDKAKNLNFEFSQNKLYIYLPKSIAIKSDMQNILNLTDYLLDIFKNNISSVSS
jgi:hypothetical protein